ncbi:uncharacterized protein [Argopecten irradians]|uniref:uncharacterized protein n=1 Tax=Argopecten irradians TaxID=31199 RepID=UPI003724444A
MDFSEETKTVKNNQFVFLKRKVNNFEDVGCWVYSCSCEPARAKLIACLDNNLDVSFDDNSTPEINEVDPSIEEVTKLSEKLFCVQSQKGPGVVEVTGAVKCLTCNSCKVHCLHLSKFLELHGSNDKDSIKTGSYQPICYSTVHIPFESTPTMQEVYKRSPVDRVSLVQQLVSSKNQVPSRPIQCINCGVGLDLEGSGGKLYNCTSTNQWNCGIGSFQ